MAIFWQNTLTISLTMMRKKRAMRGLDAIKAPKEIALDASHEPTLCTILNMLAVIFVRELIPLLNTSQSLLPSAVFLTLSARNWFKKASKVCRCKSLALFTRFSTAVEMECSKVW